MATWKRKNDSENVVVKKMNTGMKSVLNDVKQTKPDPSEKNGTFTDDCIPTDVFPIGMDIFVVINSYQGAAVVHIRKYKKHGKTFYPTREGVTLRPWWIEYIMGRKKVPEKKDELPRGLFPPENEIQITSENFLEFTFKRFYDCPDKKPVFKEIKISSEQWGEMIKNYDAIAAITLDKMFQTIDFFKAYTTLRDEPIDEALPSSLDNSLGSEFLLKMMKKSVCDIFISKGMKEPETIAEELLGHRVETFNSFAFSLDEMDLADSFFSNLWDNQDFLMMKPAYYVTKEFLKNLRLDVILREARDFMCPDNVYEYYEDLE